MSTTIPAVEGHTPLKAGDTIQSNDVIRFKDGTLVGAGPYAETVKVKVVGCEISEEGYWFRPVEKTRIIRSIGDSLVNEMLDLLGSAKAEIEALQVELASGVSEGAEEAKRRAALKKGIEDVLETKRVESAASESLIRELNRKFVGRPVTAALREEMAYFIHGFILSQQASDSRSMELIGIYAARGIAESLHISTS